MPDPMRYAGYDRGVIQTESPSHAPHQMPHDIFQKIDLNKLRVFRVGHIWVPDA